MSSRLPLIAALVGLATATCVGRAAAEDWPDPNTASASPLPPKRAWKPVRTTMLGWGIAASVAGSIGVGVGLADKKQEFFALAGGLALIGGGVMILVATLPRREPASHLAFAPVVTPTHGGAVLSFRF